MKRRSLLSVALLGGSAAALLPDSVWAAAVPPRIAGAPTDTAQLRSIIDTYLSARAQRVTRAGTTVVNGATRAMTPALSRKVAADAERLDAVRLALVDMHGGYVSAATRTIIDGVSMTATTATVRATEVTQLYFAAAKAGNPDHAAYRAEHEFVFSGGAAGWLLAEATYLPRNAYSVPVTQFVDELPQQVRDQFAPTAGAVPVSNRPTSSVRRSGRPDPKVIGAGGAQPMTGYNYQAMVDYARSWALVSRVVSGFVVWVRDNEACLLPRRWRFALGTGLVYAL